MPVIDSALVELLIAAIGGYLLGSVPFGLVIAALFGLGDLRKIGSGNIGATNVLRTGSKLGAALTLILDAGKGAIALLLARLIMGEDAAQLAALFAFLGHLYPVWLGFKGGKGVATYLGVILALFFPLGALACLFWLIGAGITRRSSLGAMTAIIATPIAAIWLYPAGVVLALALGILVAIRHKSNIKRVIEGTEPKIGH